MDNSDIEVLHQYKDFAPDSVFMVGRPLLLCGLFTPGGQALWPSGCDYKLEGGDCVQVRAVRRSPEHDYASWTLNVGTKTIWERALPGYVQVIYALLGHLMHKNEAQAFREELAKYRRKSPLPPFARDEYPAVPDSDG